MSKLSNLKSSFPKCLRTAEDDTSEKAKISQSKLFPQKSQSSSNHLKIPKLSKIESLVLSNLQTAQNHDLKTLKAESCPLSACSADDNLESLELFGTTSCSRDDLHSSADECTNELHQSQVRKPKSSKTSLTKTGIEKTEKSTQLPTVDSLKSIEKKKPSGRSQRRMEENSQANKEKMKKGRPIECSL